MNWAGISIAIGIIAICIDSPLIGIPLAIALWLAFSGKLWKP